MDPAQRLQAALAGDNDSTPLKVLMQMNAAPSLPILLKDICCKEPVTIWPKLPICRPPVRCDPVNTIADTSRTLEVHLWMLKIDAEKRGYINTLRRAERLASLVDAESVVLVIGDDKHVVIQPHARRGIRRPVEYDRFRRDRWPRQGG